MIDDKNLVCFAVFAILLSSCSLMVDGRDTPQADDPWTRILADGGTLDDIDGSTTDAVNLPDSGLSVDAAPDALTPVDASVDASIETCDVFTDSGCAGGQVCKYLGAEECLDPTGSAGEFGACSVDTECDTGLGCDGSFCAYYCNDQSDCPNNESYTCSSNLCSYI